MNSDHTHALEIIGAKKRRLQILELQAARGGTDTKPDVVMEIEDLRKEIPLLEARAANAVSGLGVPANLLTATAGPLASAAAVSAPVQLARDVAVPAPGAGSLGPQQVCGTGYHGPALVLDPPAIPAWIGRRTETVSDLQARAGKLTWFALHGNAGRGKTRLAGLLARSLGGKVVWLQFAGLGEEGGSALVERACAHLAKQPPPPHRAEWYRAACQEIGSGSVLVLDDLPDLNATPQLVARLGPLVRSCAETGVRILSTSLFPLPSAVLADLKDVVIDVPAPVFTDRDVEEVLRAFQAPEPLVTQTAKLINAISRQHPTLIVAACRYLETLEWKLDEGGMEGLFQGAHTANLAGEVQNKLLATVPDRRTRELLSRLTLVSSPFSLSELDAVAGAPPPIDTARERLTNVTNSWIEQRSRDSWVLSPLLGIAVSDNVPPAERRACHFALAESYVGTGTMNQHRAFLAVTHFHLAEEYGRSGALLLVALNGFQQYAAQVADEPILKMWTTVPLPEGIDLNIRLSIRGLHLLLFHKLGKPLEYLLADFEALVNQVTEEERYGLAGAISYAIMGIGRKYPTECGRWFRKFLKLPAPKPPKAGKRPKSKVGELPELGEEFPLHVLLWMMIGELTTAAHVNDWLDTVEAMSGELRQRTFKTVLTEDDTQVRCVVVADALTGAEQAKPPETRDWPVVVARLTEFAVRARGLRVEPLWAAFVRAKITAQAEFCRDVDAALATATEAAGLASADPLVNFMIDGTIGRQLLLAKRYQEARFWLGMALKRKTDAIYPYDRANVLIAASNAFGLEDPGAGVTHALDAAAVAESSEDVPAIDRVRAWSELGVAQFLATGAEPAFRSWDRAGEYLFGMTNRNDFWKEQMVLFGHTVGYIAKVAETGAPPASTLSGDPYTAPERGVFMTTNPARVSFFNAQNEGSLWRILGYYADAVGQEDVAKKWKARAAEAGRRDSLLALVAEAERDNIPRVLLEEGYQAALEAGRKAGRAIVAFRNETDQGRSGHVPDAEMPKAVALLTHNDRRSVEDFGMIIGLLPAAFAVATLAVGSGTQARARGDAVTLVAACRAMSATSLVPDVWDRMAELLERAYVHDQPMRQIRDWYDSFTEPMPPSFLALARIAATANATPTEAFGAMLAVMPHLCGYYPPNTTIHRDILMPFVVAYWTHKFEHQRALFGFAMVIESQLPEAIAAPAETRIVAVFRALHAGMRVGTLPDEVRGWLFGT